jgi:agmatinase
MAIGSVNMQILNAMPKYNLFGLESQDYESARIVVLPIPYEATLSYKSGAKDGPHAIIEASRNMELYNEELGKDASRMGIYTLDELAPDYSSPENMVKRIEREVSLILEDKKLPFLIGGEHTVSVGAINAIGKKEKDFSVLHFDAHSDSRDEFMGTKYSHACIMARAREITKSCYSIGVRSVDEDSAKRYGKEILYMKDMRGMSNIEIARKAIEMTKKKVYITLDLDALDPSEMPSVGTPEPDGMRFSQLSDILKLVIKEKDILGIDMTELSPLPSLSYPNYTAAKLAYLIIGYTMKGA